MQASTTDLTDFADTAKIKQFKQLQNQLRDRWKSVDLFDGDDYDILVIPSVSLDQRELLKIAGGHHYEERLLFSLIRLRNPRTRVIYLTSQPLHPLIIDYYLQLLPGIPFSHARDRLQLLSTYDSSPHQSLTQKILDRPRLMARIKKVLRPDHTFMICFNSTVRERELSVKLNVPLLAVDPELLYWGTKSGSREIFAEAGIDHPDGSDLCLKVEDLAGAAASLWERQPTLERIVVKLNEGFSGEGNALLDLRVIPEAAPGKMTHENRAAIILDRFQFLKFEAPSETWANYASRIPELGAIVEAFIEGEHKQSPSVQGLIMPDGQVEILSTHDQILGGAGGQIYLGCNFPAQAAYRLALQEMGRQVGEALAAKGALERFGVDFVVQQIEKNGDRVWDIQAIEINLRKGGTTHPFMTLKFLTNGRYDRATGLFYSQQGRPKYYVASDNLQKPQYRGMLPNDLIDIIAHHRLHFDTSTETGTVFHLMGCLSEFGKLGLTSIGDSPHHAQEIYDEVINVLDRETSSGENATSLIPQPLRFS